MKLSRKLLLTLTMLTSITPYAQGHWFYSGSHILAKIHRYGNDILTPALSIGYLFSYRNTIDNAPEAPPAVVEFCRKKAAEHGLNPNEIVVKAHGHDFIAALERRYIAFSPDCARDLDTYLSNPGDEQSEAVVKIYSTLLDHELAHLKNNDSTKRMLAFVGSSVICSVISHYIRNRSCISSWFNTPTTFREFCIMWASYGVVGYLNVVVPQTIREWYAQRQESAADDYAIAHAKDPKALRSAAKFLERSESGIIEFLHNESAWQRLGFAKRMQMTMLQALCKAEYARQAPSADFKTWISQQPDIIAHVKEIVDPEHPDGYKRAKKMREAADKLEASAAIA